jgi:hypothetical protein
MVDARGYTLRNETKPYFCEVKKCFLMFMLSAYLFTGTESHELFRLHHLFNHFVEHMQNHTDEGFLNFIDSHYAGTHADDDPRHADLPFGSKHKLTSCQGISPAVIHSQPFSLSRPVFALFALQAFYHNPPSEGIKATVFQPPRFV